MYSCKGITQDFHLFSFGFGHFEVFEDFSLAASFFKYSSTSFSGLVLYFLLSQRFYFDVVLYKV